MSTRHIARISRTGLSGIISTASTLVLAFCCANPALAQEEEPASPIVVTGYGLDDGSAVPAYDVTTIDRDALTASASGRIEDVLSSVAGFSEYRRSDSRSANPSAQGATLRALGGNASSRALVLLDGVPVANPFFGYIPFSALSPDRLSSVRVVRGGGMGAFGMGAVSGTIDLTSAGPDEIGLLKGEALINDRGETQLSATTAPCLGEGFIVASVQWDKGEGFWTTPKEQRVDASARAAYETLSGSLRAVAPLTDTIEVQAAGLVYDDNRTLRFKGADSTSSGQQGSLRLVGRGDWQFDVLGYVQAQNFSNIVMSSTYYTKTLDQQKTPTLAVGGKFELRPPVGEAHVLRLGADIRAMTGKAYEVGSSPVSGATTYYRTSRGDQSDLGLFLEDDWTIGNVVLTGGVRADHWTITDGSYVRTSAAGVQTADSGPYPDRSDWAVNGRAGLLWHATGGLDLRAAAYSSMRMPTLNELYRPYVVVDVTTNANPNLKPEQLYGFEGGVDFVPVEGVKLSLTAFDNRLEDAISNVFISTNTYQRQNVKAIDSEGIEAAAHLALGQVTFDGSLSWTDATVDAPGTDADGLRPAQVAKLATSATLAWAPAEGWRLAATVRHTGKQYEDDQEQYALPAVTTLDAYVRIPVLPQVAVTLRGENLTDETIWTRNQGGSVDLGTPRTVWAGVSFGLD